MDDNLYDPFEPGYIRISLEKASAGKISTGHLIFGSSWWSKIASEFGFHVADQEDSLSKLFRKKGDLPPLDDDKALKPVQESQTRRHF